MRINNQLPCLRRVLAGRHIRYALALMLGLSAFGHVAAQGTDEPVFEEITVTAQKRVQNIMDVPIAVTAVTGAEIEASGIFDVFALQQNVPGLIVGQSQTATTSNFAIRGIGSTSNNFGVESSVGLYVDGVYRSRQSSMINDLVDVEAVEVLRGPQGTLFGKNTPSGAIQIRTVRPSQGTDAFIDVTAGDFGLVKLSAAANISLTDNIAFRGTLFSSQRDGYVDDIRLGNDLLNDRDRIGGRLQLAFNEVGDDLNWRLIVDYAEIDEICCVGVSQVDSLYSRASVTDPMIPFVNGSDAALVAFGGTVFTDFPYPQPLIDAFALFPGTIVTGAGFDEYQTALNTLPRSTNEDTGVSFEINKTLGNGMTLTSLSAFRSFDTFDLIDADFTDVDILGRTNNAEQKSFSQEFRLAGEFGEGSHFVVGAYYFGQEIKSFADTFGGLFLGPYLSAVTPELQPIIDGINAISAGTGLVAPAADPFPTGTFAEDTVVQDHNGWAAFGQVDFVLSDSVTLTLGARYTDETKDIDARYVQNAQGPQPDLRDCLPVDPLNPLGDYTGGAICVALTEAAIFFQTGGAFGSLDGVLAGDLDPAAQPNDGWGSYSFPPLSPRPDLNTTLSDDQVTGTAKLSWFANDSSMFYLSYSTGFKAGGTNTDRINPSFDQIFGPETSESIELGFKGDLGPVRISIALYDTQYEDFQANSFTGTGFNLQNAGDVDTQGFEVEVHWLPTDSLDVQAFYARSEGDYKTFVDGTCRGASVFHTLMPDPGSGGDINAEGCDRSGDPIPYNPEDRVFIAVTQNFDIGSDTNMFVRAEYSYYSEQFTDGDLDPLTLQDDVSLVNLRIGFNFDAWNSSLTLWGRNITDERYYHGSFDRPIQLGINSYPSEPATYGLTFRKNFD